MTWRGSASTLDRIAAAAAYILPLIYALQFGRFLIGQFPVLQYIYLPLLPFISIISFPFAGIIIFFALFLGVVRNERISHFIRFNTMQAILIDIAIILIGFIVSILGGALGGLLVETLFNTVFLAVLIACGYSIIQSGLGKYAEIPGISEAAYSQVR